MNLAQFRREARKAMKNPYRSKKFKDQDIEAALSEYGGKIEQVPAEEDHELPAKEWPGYMVYKGSTGKQSRAMKGVRPHQKDKHETYKSHAQWEAEGRRAEKRAAWGEKQHQARIAKAVYWVRWYDTYSDRQTRVSHDHHVHPDGPRGSIGGVGIGSKGFVPLEKLGKETKRDVLARAKKLARQADKKYKGHADVRVFDAKGKEVFHLGKRHPTAGPFDVSGGPLRSKKTLSAPQGHDWPSRVGKKNPLARRNHHLVVGERVKLSDRAIRDLSARYRDNLVVRPHRQTEIKEIDKRVRKHKHALMDLEGEVETVIGPEWASKNKDHPLYNLITFFAADQGDGIPRHEGYFVKWAADSGYADDGRWGKTVLGKALVYFAPDRAVVSAESTSRKWPGNHYEGVDPMAKKNGRARRNMAYPKFVAGPFGGTIQLDDKEEFDAYLASGTGAAAPAATRPPVGPAKSSHRHEPTVGGQGDDMFEEEEKPDRTPIIVGNRVMSLIGGKGAFCPTYKPRKRRGPRSPHYSHMKLAHFGMSQKQQAAFLKEMQEQGGDRAAVVPALDDSAGWKAFLPSWTEHDAKEALKVARSQYGLGSKNSHQCAIGNPRLGPSPTIGHAQYYRQPTNAGPYTPQTFPYGYGGRPATYSLAKKNASRGGIADGREGAAETLAMLRKGTIMTCPTCRARGYEPCVSSSGKKTKAHAARVKKAKKYAEHLGVDPSIVARNNSSARRIGRYAIQMEQDYPGWASKGPVEANWTAYPTYAYEQFSRSNPRSNPVPVAVIVSQLVMALVPMIVALGQTQVNKFKRASIDGKIKLLKKWSWLSPPVRAAMQNKKLARAVATKIDEVLKDPEAMQQIQAVSVAGARAAQAGYSAHKGSKRQIATRRNPNATRVEYPYYIIKRAYDLPYDHKYTLTPNYSVPGTRFPSSQSGSSFRTLAEAKREGVAYAKEIAVLPHSRWYRPPYVKDEALLNSRRNPRLRPVPSHISPTPRAAAERISAIGVPGQWPIGDLFHARLALIYAMAPNNYGKHKQILKAVERAYPQYDWAKWWEHHMAKLRRRGRKDKTLASKIELAAANPREISSLILS